MISLLCFLAFNGSPDVLQIPDFMTSPEVYFGDANNDGIGDIWVTDRDQGLWIWDGGSQATSFEKVPFTPIGLKVKPVGVNGTWQAHAYEDGRVYAYRAQDGWTVHLDLAADARIRPGLEPLVAPEGMLIPTYDGYHLADGPCVLQRFKAMPAAELDQHHLRLRYPKPRWRDMNGDGRRDLIASPVQFTQRGELGIWSAIHADAAWATSWSHVIFPSDLNAERVQFGDMDGDGFDEMAVLARPAKDMSIFEELSLFVYQGTGLGQWEPVSIQQLKTKQNLWQTGPIEMNGDGIFLYYYKGIIRSHFKIDRYRWDPAGFLKPKPDTTKWTLKDAERDMIVLHDLQGKGRKDLILSAKDGFIAYTRDANAKLPFDQSSGKPLFSRNRTISTPGGKEDIRLRQRIRKNYLRRPKEVALVESNGITGMWTYFLTDSGKWYVARL